MKQILFRSYQPGEDSVIVEITEEEFSRVNKYTVKELENVMMTDEDAEWLNDIYCRGKKVCEKDINNLSIDLEIPRT